MTPAAVVERTATGTHWPPAPARATEKRKPLPTGTAEGSADTLTSVVDLAAATIDGCDYAGIFLLDGDVVTAPAHTDPIVIEVDSLQHVSGEGPCLDAITHRMVFYAEDLLCDLAGVIAALAAIFVGCLRQSGRLVP